MLESGDEDIDFDELNRKKNLSAIEKPPKGELEESNLSTFYESYDKL